MQEGVLKGLPYCHISCPSLEGSATRLEGLRESHVRQTDPGDPSTLQLLDPATKSSLRRPAESPPGTEDQGQKSRQKNVFLPAFHRAARG